MRKLIELGILFGLCTGLAHGATWYINAGGGPRYNATDNPTGTCDGTSAAAPVGSTPNQHCAFNDIRMLWADGGYTTNPGAGYPLWGWIGASGDTYLIDCSGMTSGSCRIGQTGPSNGQGFGLQGSPTSSGMPTPISGTSGAPTHIWGINHASCSTGSALGNRTQINGGYGVDATVSMYNASYVDIQCLDVTDFSSCGKSGQTNACNAAYPFSDYSTSGILWFKTSTNNTVTHVTVHGMASNGMYGPIGGGNTFTDLDLLGNASSGWNADLADGNTGTGASTVQNFEIAWNGCAQEYPIVDALPYQDCTDDNHSGYGDGFGTASISAPSPGWQMTFSQGQVYNNTQDGLDALHLNGTGSSMKITRVLAYGNMGQQLKNGGANGVSVNNVIVTNCNAMRQAIPGTPSGYNSNLSDFCRAADEGLLMTVQSGATTVFDDNTVYMANQTGVFIEAGAEYDSTASIDWRNNQFFLFVNGTATGYTSGYTNEYSNPIDVDSSAAGIFTNSGSLYSHNGTYPVYPTSNWACPQTGETYALCTNPQLADETWHLYGYGNMAPASSTSAVQGSGVAISGITTDFAGTTRPNPPSIGAYQFVGTTAPTVSGSIFGEMTGMW